MIWSVLLLIQCVAVAAPEQEWTTPGCLDSRSDSLQYTDRLPTQASDRSEAAAASPVPQRRRAAARASIKVEKASLRRARSNSSATDTDAEKTLKLCRRCNQTKALNCFYRSKANPGASHLALEETGCAFSDCLRRLVRRLGRTLQDVRRCHMQGAPAEKAPCGGINVLCGSFASSVAVCVCSTARSNLPQEFYWKITPLVRAYQ